MGESSFYHPTGSQTGLEVGAPAMYSVQELRAYADEHLDWARTARTDRERRIFLQMAWAWLEIAIRLEGLSNGSAQASGLTIQ
jgi:hypothetical protein